MAQKPPIKVPIGEIPDYNQVFYVMSPLDRMVGEAFLNRVGGQRVGIEEASLAPQGMLGIPYTSLKRLDEYIERYFGFTPETHIQINGFRGNMSATEEGIQRFVQLANNTRTVITTDQDNSNNRYYVSDDLL